MEVNGGILYPIVQLIIVIFCVAFSNYGSAVASPSYVVTAPKYARANSSYDVSVTIINSNSDVIVNVTLGDYYRENVTVHDQMTFTNGSSGVIRLQIPARFTPISSYVTLIVRASGGLSFYKSDYVIILSKTLSIFIQSDKAAYKPGQLVRFRVIAVNQNLLPFRDAMNVTITDNSGNKIAQWLNQRNDTGVFTGSLQLSDEPPLGTWSITATAQNNVVTKSFDVAEYVLPKFKVTVDLPSYYLVLVNRQNLQRDLNIKVTAMYTYDQPVRGSAVVNISLVSYYYETTYYRLVNVQLTNGSADIRLNISDLFSLLPLYYQTNPWSYLSYRQILVVANVTESVTGKTLTGNNSVQCTQQKYTLSFLDITSSTYKPGLPFTVYMQLKQIDGSPPDPDDIYSNPVVINSYFSSSPNYPYYPPYLAYSPYGGSRVARQAAEKKPANIDPVPSQEPDANQPNFNPLRSHSTDDVPELHALGGAASGSRRLGRRVRRQAVTTPRTTTRTTTWWSYVPRMETLTVSVPASGFIVVSTYVTKGGSMSAYFADRTTSNTIRAHKSMSSYLSRDEQGIQITLDDYDAAVKPGQTVQFSMATNVDTTTVFYQILSKGSIIRSGQLTDPPSRTHQLNISIDNELASKLTPNPRIIVWYLTPRGELIADTLDFTVSGAFANNVSVSFSASTVRPADNVTVSVSAYSQSFVGLLAVDQSVLLLKSGNDITRDQVLDDLSKYAIPSYATNYYHQYSPYCYYYSYYCYWRPSATFTSNTFSNAGVILFTDAYLYNWYDYYNSRPPTGGVTGATGLPGPEGTFPGPTYRPTAAIQAITTTTTTTTPGGVMPDEPPDTLPSSRIRTNFPETWLWTELVAGSDGQATLRTTVPDTITSWVLSAFAVSSTAGLGVAPQNVARLTAFKPFFVSVNLPYSVKRSERLAMQITVFNYLSVDTRATVTLASSADFDVLNPISGAVTSRRSWDIPSVGSNDAASISVLIVPLRLGLIPIEVNVISAAAADSVRVMLLVEAEGLPQEYSTTVMFRLSPGQQTDTATLNISLPGPELLVPDSQSFIVTAIGDLIGSSLSNLKDLLRLPGGCGEQTMSSFAPDVYILKYFLAIGRSIGSIGDTAIGYIRTGYQRMLNFQRLDGSFAIMGTYDRTGCVWLSAFVAKIFHECQQFIPIDDWQIAQILSWLLTRQSANGSFSEPPGAYIPSANMQGGAGGGSALTAYVLIALIENSDNSVVNRTQFSAARAKAVQFLESQFSASLVTDNYTLSVVTYALTLANSSLADSALQALNALAIVKDGMKYWKVSRPNYSYNSSWYWQPPYQQARASDIEMTAYALLSYSRRRDFSNCIQIAKWIVTQRNSYGGFSSTQDTVMALHALADFASWTYGYNNSANQNMSISVTAGSFTSRFLAVTFENTFVLQSIQLPSTSNQVRLDATGTGFALVQLIVRYNIRSSVIGGGVYNKTGGGGGAGVQQNVSKEQRDQEIIIRCDAKYLGPGVSGMAIVEVNLLTGYSALDGDGQPNVQRNRSVVKRVDSDASKVVFYVDELTSSGTTVSVVLAKSTPVKNVQPATVRTYLYYDPDQEQVSVYQPDADTQSWCEECPNCCLNQTVECNTGFFWCSNGSCLSNTLRCNGAVDCPGGSDEVGCLPTPSTSTVSTTTVTLPVPSCSRLVDVVLVVDTSGSVGEQNFELIRSALKQLVAQLDVDGGNVRVGLVTFSTDVHPRFNLSTYSSRAAILADLSTMTFVVGTTNTAAALNHARTAMLTGATGDRSNAPNVVIVITDGASTNPLATQDTADSLRRMGGTGLPTQLIAVGVGKWTNVNELNNIASWPYNRNVISVANYSALASSVRSLIDEVCGGEYQCTQSPCLNGATCLSLQNTYICLCPPGYAGHNCDQVCRSGADVAFVISASGIMGWTNFQLVLNFVRQLVYGLNVNRKESQVALVVYSNDSYVRFRLNDFNNFSLPQLQNNPNDYVYTQLHILNAISQYYLNGRGNLAAGLRSMRDDVFGSGHGSRAGVRKVCVVVTSSASYNESETVLEAMSARNDLGVQIIGVGVGGAVSRSELEGVVSYPTSHNVFYVAEYTALDSVVPNVTSSLCNQINECSSSPCQNGGSCDDVINGFVCQCPSSFTGKYCDRIGLKRVDLVIAVDLSERMRYERLPVVLDFLSGLVDNLEVGSDKTRVGLVGYSDTAYVQFNLNSYYNKQDVMYWIRRVEYRGGLAVNRAAALQLMLDAMFTASNGDRPDAPNVVLFYSDDRRSNVNQQNVIATSIRLRQAGVALLVFGVLSGEPRNVEMNAIASLPTNRTVFAVTSSSQFTAALVGDVLSAIIDGVNECINNPCLNGATCENRYFSYRCHCPAGYTDTRCQRQCSHQMDVAFIIDRSEYFDFAASTWAVSVAQQVVYGLPVGSGAARVAVVTYGDNATVNFPLNTYNSTDDIVTAMSFDYMGSRSHLQEALDLLSQSVFTSSHGARVGITPIALILTDGWATPSDPRSVVTLANTTRQLVPGLQIHVVGIGPDAQSNVNNINGMANVVNYTSYVNSDDQIESVVNGLLDKMCAL